MFSSTHHDSYRQSAQRGRRRSLASRWAIISQVRGTISLTFPHAGTIYLEDLLRTQGEDIILQPRPSTDPNDPLNWPRWRKYLNFGLAAFYVVMVFTLIDVATPTWGPMNTELGFSYDILNDSYAVGAASLTLGAFFLIPFALKYGRRPIYIISTALQFGVAIWSAKIQTVADLMLVNVFGCGLGALADVICQMTIADVFFVHERGLMTSISVWTSNVGGQLAPVAAGYITTNEGWRWVWWWTTIFFGVTFLAFVFLYEETKFTQPTIEAIESYDPQSRQLATLEASSNDDTKTSKIDEMPAGADLEKSTLPPSDGPSIDHSIPQKTYLQRLNLLTTSPGSWEMFARHAWQPVVILVTNPTVFYVSLVYGGCIATNTVLITTLSSWMTLPPYNFDSAQIGLMSLPAWIGTSLGTLVCGPVSDWLILKLARRNNGIYEPEMRLYDFPRFSCFEAHC